ncbi:MAG: penicillin-binding protein 2 [Frankiales bacterium]|nr:penicillin-binding protein 2 [Frankiales bacterium]
MNDHSALRLVVLRVLVVSILLTLLGRLGYLQVAEGAHYRSAASANRVREIITPAARGQILDARGKPLVSNRTDLVVSVTRSILRSQKDKGAAVLQRLSRVVGIPADQIALLITPCGERIKKGVVARAPNCWNGSPLQPVPIQSYRADDLAQIRDVLAIEEHAEDFPGISATYAAVRKYDQGSLAAHVLGYLGPLSQDEAKKPKYKGQVFGSVIGRTGVEAVYDDQLRGVNGVEKLQVDLNSTVTGKLGTVSPIAGDNLVLSIDAGIQKAAEDALAQGMAAARTRTDPSRKRHFIAPKGTAIVVDVTNGQVVAMASNPTYDPAEFVPRITKKNYDVLTSTPGDPLTSAATQGLFAPGSTFKIVSTAAAVKAGNSITGFYPCPGSLKLGNRVFHNFEGESTPNSIDFRTTLIKSCDTVYYQLAYNDWIHDGGTHAITHPREVFPKMARSWGFGSKSGIDLPDERTGLITDRVYKQHFWEQNKTKGLEYCRHAKQGYPAEPDKARAAYLTLLAKEFCTDGYRYNAGDAALFAIGQGDVLVSPIQLAMAYAALANGGTVFEPRLSKGFLSADGKSYSVQAPVIKGKLPVSAPVLSYIRSALQGVVQPGGTAQGAFAGFPLGQVPLAGKTGTADVLNKSPTSWFASFAPANKPRYAMVVMVTEAGTGGTTAAPISRQIWNAMYGFGGHKPLLDPGGQLPAALPVVLPNGSIGPPGTVVPVPPTLRKAADASAPTGSGTQALGAPVIWLAERRTGRGPS